MESKCGNCAFQLDPLDDFCRRCGTSAKSQPHLDATTQTGEGSLNIGIGNLPNANIHVGDRYETKSPEVTAYIDRTLAREVKVGNNTVKISWLIISGGLGVVGSIASILSYWPSLTSPSLNTPRLPSIWLWIGVISLLILGIGILLYKYRFVKLGWINVEADNSGQLYLTKVGGVCPRCNSTLKLKDVGPKDHKVTMVVCDRNPTQHQWHFDPTVLPDMAKTR